MRSLATLLLVGLAAVEAQDQCYYAAGKPALDQYIPCGNGGGVSACCVAGDFCLEDGACYSPGTKMTYIAGCTDSTYSDSSCKGGSDTCNKSSQFQGLALCGNNWVCCNGQGQSGDLPANGYSTDCPCDQNFATAIANVASLPGTESLGTSFASHAATSSSSSPSSTSGSTTTTKKSSGGGAASNSAKPTTMSTISLNEVNGITGTGAGSAAATTSAASSGSGSGLSTNSKIGIGVGVPLGVAAIAAISVFLFCFRKRWLNREPQYVTQADLSTPVWVGEAPGSGAPAARDPNAYAGNSGAGAAGAGWKGNERSSQMSEVGTPPPQYQTPAGQANGAAATGANNTGGGGLDRPQSQGIWQPGRLQALQ